MVGNTLHCICREMGSSLAAAKNPPEELLHVKFIEAPLCVGVIHVVISYLKSQSTFFSSPQDFCLIAARFRYSSGAEQAFVPTCFVPSFRRSKVLSATSSQDELTETWRRTVGGRCMGCTVH
ncbi:hypothetical protein TNCV_3584171 [Trichonephila clavipes]|nr:hypothetical protein TNCV_3584171 [Trichonephila clavipes]